MSEVRKIKRKDLDLEKYSKALSASLNYRVYAEYWYLDVVSKGNWECLVYGDYEVLMPISFQRKFGFKFVLQPLYCQQLGVFYPKEISTELFQKFESKLHQYRVRSYHFNEENTSKFNPKGEKRINYVLELNPSYEEIKRGFSKSTKWNLKQFEKSQIPIKNSDFSFKSAVDLKVKTSLKPFSKELLFDCFQVLANHNRLKIFHIELDGNMEAYACFVRSGNRWIYISAATKEQGKKIAAPTGFLHEIIEKYSHQNFELDFEGSMIPQINYFFKGFGGNPNEYTFYKNIF